MLPSVVKCVVMCVCVCACVVCYAIILFYFNFIFIPYSFLLSTLGGEKKHNHNDNNAVIVQKNNTITLCLLAFPPSSSPFFHSTCADHLYQPLVPTHLYLLVPTTCTYSVYIWGDKMVTCGNIEYASTRLRLWRQPLRQPA